MEGGGGRGLSTMILPQHFPTVMQWNWGLFNFMPKQTRKVSHLLAWILAGLFGSIFFFTKRRPTGLASRKKSVGYSLSFTETVLMNVWCMSRVTCF